MQPYNALPRLCAASPPAASPDEQRRVISFIFKLAPTRQIWSIYVMCSLPRNWKQPVTPHCRLMRKLFLCACPPCLALGVREHWGSFGSPQRPQSSCWGTAAAACPLPGDLKNCSGKNQHSAAAVLSASPTLLSAGVSALCCYRVSSPKRSIF